MTKTVANSNFLCYKICVRCETDTPRKEQYRIEETILFGKYRIISVLGAGSSGTVYLARHLKLDVYRAIKCIPKDTALCKSAAGRSSDFSESSLLDEANFLKTLNHPSIPLIYDIDEDDDFLYMIEEFIEGESLENFILYQNHIPQELIIEYGIQLCEILDYLHHVTPYPILYQDLKPEHILLCGNQIKLIDFGIASFLIGSGNHSQRYGTEGFAAPEAYLGHAVGVAADIYGLGKVLSFMADAAKPLCSAELLRIISKASSEAEAARYQTASELKDALLTLRKPDLISENHTHFSCQASSHSIRKIAVLGSRPGAGATHFAISLVSALNHKKRKSIYLPANHSNTLTAMAESNIFWKETGGIFHYEQFSGIPHYGNGLESLIPEDAILVYDYGTCMEEFSQDPEADLIFLVMSGSLWDMPDCIPFARQFQAQENVCFICNYDNKKAAKKYARQLKKSVYCFPFDCTPFHSTAKKERLIMHIIQKKEVNHHVRHWWKRDKTSFDHRHRRLRFRSRRHTSCSRPGKFLRL